MAYINRIAFLGFDLAATTLEPLNPIFHKSHANPIFHPRRLKRFLVKVDRRLVPLEDELVTPLMVR